MWSFGNSNWEGMPKFTVDDYYIHYEESFVDSSGYYNATIIAYGRVFAPVTGMYTFEIGSSGS